MSSINKICREYNWVCKHIKGPLYRIKMQELYAEVNKAMKDSDLTPEQKPETFPGCIQKMSNEKNYWCP